MKVKVLMCGAILVALAAMAPGVFAYSPVPQDKTPADGSKQQAPQKIDKKEEDAYKAFHDAGDPAKKIELGENFLKKYPMSRYVEVVYSQLTTAYLGAGQNDKMFVAGAKALELNPNDVSVLALLAWAIPRVNANAPDAAAQFQTAENYAKHAIEMVPTMTKADGVDDATFEKGKNESLSMAHSGLGLIDYRRQKYGDAAAELSQAVQLASKPDPTDYYLLGNADLRTSHFSDAVAAYAKCSDDGNFVQQCKAGAEDAKKKASTQLSAPN